MNKPIFDIDAMCSILKRQGIESSEYTDCTILYSVTFEQLRSLFTEGYQTGLVELLPLQRQVAMLRAALDQAVEFIDCDTIIAFASEMKLVNGALADTQATAETYMAEHDAKVLEEVLRCDSDFSFLRNHIKNKICELRAAAKKGEVK